MITFLLPSHDDYSSLRKVIQDFTNEDVSTVRLVVVDSGAEENVKKELGTVTDSRIKIIHGEKNGIYQAINRGIAEVETEYYIVIGLDDTFRFDKVCRLVEALRVLQYDLAFLGVVKGERKIAYFNPNRILDGPQGVFPSHTGGSVIRKELHDRYGLYEARYKTVADGFFLCRCLKEGCSAVFLGETFCTIGAAGFSKKKELSAEWESHLARLMLGAGWMRSSGLFCIRAGKRALKRIVNKFKVNG